ncbi:polyprotein of EF-Ts, chloroplastic-like [Rutidosis leptorrhynchoides]|uniref:polyprotein of EF-Ts, chloroplastic-like n=1 Tax=Rutidosis leptorrhynchoides TaxID=125765 RepID=UPI003A9A05D3
MGITNGLLSNQSHYPPVCSWPISHLGQIALECCLDVKMSSFGTKIATSMLAKVNMNPVVTYSLSNISFIPRSPFTIRQNNYLARGSVPKKSSKRFVLPLSPYVQCFPSYKRVCEKNRKSQLHICSAAETDVVVEEPGSPVAEDTSEKTATSAADASGQSKRTRPARKSEMPPVSNEQLVPGASFTGKVRSIQPFGAFVDFGAFTDGLVHVSRLSDSFVKDVGKFVSVGQEVTVKLVEANMEAGRISFSMRESDDSPKLQQRNDSPDSSDKQRPPRRNTSKSKSTKLVKGQDLKGTVKNLTRSGSFISLPDGEEGFLPHSEESDDGLGSMMGGSSLEVGQEVDVRVLRIARGSATLTMKKAEDGGKLDTQLSKLSTGGHVASNPFLLAFRKNSDIAAFLDAKEKDASVAPPSNIPEEMKGEATPTESVSDVPLVDNAVEEDEPSNEEDLGVDIVKDENTVSSVSEVVEEETDEGSKTVSPEENVLIENEIAEQDSTPGAPQTIDNETQILEEKTENETTEEAPKSPGNVETQAEQNSTPSAAQTIDNETQILEEKKENETTEQAPNSPENVETQALEEVTEVSEPLAAVESVAVENEIASQDLSSESLQGKVPESDAGNGTAGNEIPSAAVVEEVVVDPTPDVKGTVASSSVESDVPSPQETKPAISPALVKQLRDETGAGMMDCKNALSETGGDIVKAQEFLRKKGLASADKKSSRATAEGRIGSYIHDSRIGVLIEVNCETDFVSRGEIFKELVDDLAMQIAAYPQVEYLVTEDVPEEIVNKEKEIEMQKEDLMSKPEQIRSKIVEGRIRKRLEELALLEQPYIKNDKMVVKDWVKQTIATIGENIKVKRFVRYNLGEGLEKKSQDFAAEVAAQTAVKPVSTPDKEQPPAAKIEETIEKPKTTTVSAALVKQLREETGAGMMDCKKALAETEGDLEKAQEYLRKKGLSSADKKSSRIAAEGRIGSYIHDARIGVLIEVNCETDFVGRSERFKELVDDLAMQVAACPQVQHVSIEDIPEEIRNKEKEIEMQREDLQSKPENIREKIVEGRVSKRLGELALLEQPYIKDDGVLIKDLVKQTVASIGENIKVRRFVRFTLGETIENSSKAETEA